MADRINAAVFLDNPRNSGSDLGFVDQLVDPSNEGGQERSVGLHVKLIKSIYKMDLKGMFNSR